MASLFSWGVSTRDIPKERFRHELESLRLPRCCCVVSRLECGSLVLKLELQAWAGEVEKGA
jgi:hypothetical protein